MANADRKALEALLDRLNLHDGYAPSNQGQVVDAILALLPPVASAPAQVPADVQPNAVLANLLENRHALSFGDQACAIADAIDALRAAPVLPDRQKILSLVMKAGRGWSAIEITDLIFAELGPKHAEMEAIND